MKLTGNYFNAMDGKGRVFIPTKLRCYLGERVWLVRGIDSCLNIFTQEAWADYTERYVNNRSLTDKRARKLQRFVFGGSREVEIDKQGRVNLPQDQIDYAGIVKDVAFVGCGEYIELWDAEAYAREMDPAGFDPDELMRDADAAGEKEAAG